VVNCVLQYTYPQRDNPAAWAPDLWQACCTTRSPCPWLGIKPRSPNTESVLLAFSCGVLSVRTDQADRRQTYIRASPYLGLELKFSETLPSMSKSHSSSSSTYVCDLSQWSVFIIGTDCFLFDVRAKTEDTVRHRGSRRIDINIACRCLKDIDSKSHHEISVMMDVKSVLETRIIVLLRVQVCVVCRKVVTNLARRKVKLTRQKCCVCRHAPTCLLTRPLTSRHV